MDLGNMLGKVTEMMGGMDGIMDRLDELGIDTSELMEMDAEGLTAMLEEKGINLSMLEGLGLSVEDILDKIKGA